MNIMLIIIKVISLVTIAMISVGVVIIEKPSVWAILSIGEHTSYLSFPLHRQDFQIPNFTPKNS